MTRTLPPWPYPRWIAHRGAGQLAPENTLAAFRLGARHGYRMFECDAKLSADGVAFLLHDDTLTRTTNAGAALPDGASAAAGDHAWGALAQLDAGSWHSRAYAGEPLASLDAVTWFCLRNGLLLNIEIKPSPGVERLTGQVVASLTARRWADARVAPLLTSFDPVALEGARQTAPQLPRGLLLETAEDGWLVRARELGCVAVVCDHLHWDADQEQLAKSAGLRTLCYTVNAPDRASQLLTLGLDGLITDRVDLFSAA